MRLKLYVPLCCPGGMVCDKLMPLTSQKQAVSVVLAFAAEASVTELVAVNAVVAAKSDNPLFVQPGCAVADIDAGTKESWPAWPSASPSLQPEPPLSLKSYVNVPVDQTLAAPPVAPTLTDQAGLVVEFVTRIF